VSECGFDARTVRLDRPGELDESGNLAALRPGQPRLEHRHRLGSAKLEDLSELLLHQVGAVQSIIGPLDVGELSSLALSEVLRVLP
jgi:hypothetical protein